MGRITGTTVQPVNQPVKATGGSVQQAPTSRGRITGGGISVGGSPSPVSNGDLRTVGGLRQTALSAGLDKQVARIPAQGEVPNKLYSGGFISDVFDTLNALQYGTTGVLKGKSFVEGVKTRQSFTDKDALGDKGIPGLVAGIALDIAVDPLTYINPLSALTKISKATKLAKPLAAGGRIIAETKPAKFLGRQLVYRFGQDPVYKALAERNIKNVGVQNQSIVKLFSDIKDISSADQKIIATARKAGKLESLPPELLSKAQPIFTRLDNLSREAIKELDLPPNMVTAYENGVGNYMKRLYRKYETPNGIVDGAKAFFQKKPQRLEGSLFKARKDIPDELRAAWGEIEEFGYPTAKSMLQLNTAVENAKFFSKTAQSFGTDVFQEGMEQLPKTFRLGKLSGKFVPKAIADDLNEIIRIPSELEKKLGTVVGAFKYSKVVLNPATHARNVVSNLMLNNFEGLSPARLDIYAKAAKEVARPGKWYKEAAEQGLGLNTFAAQEIKGFLDAPELTKLGKASSGVKNAMAKVADTYQKEEEFAKMAQYIFQRTSKGLSPEEAWKVAERATFNYAQVTPFIRRMRESIFGFPFITFTYKATPQVVKTIATNPTKISNIGKIKEGIENFTDQKELTRERASEPDWVRNGFYMKLPIKDEHGRSAYFDLTYILPFGDLVSGNFFDRSIDRETGLQEGLPESGLRKAAFPNTVKELATNQDFYGNKIYLDSDSSDKQLLDIMNYLTKVMAPPLLADQLPGGYRSDGSRRQNVRERVSAVGNSTPGELGFNEAQARTLQQELLRATGFKINPVDIDVQETLQQSQQKKAYETILQEGGVTRKFQRTYIPKQ